MAKTFITPIEKNILTGFYNEGTDIVKKISDLCADAIDKIVDLFERYDLSKIDIINYDEYFNLIEGDITVIRIDRVELCEGTIYVYDTDGNDYTSEYWYDKAPQLLQELATCLEMKFNDLEQLAVGKKVRWIDPEIEDYDKEDRQDMLERVFTVVDCPDEIEQDSVILIANDETEVEALPMELVLMPD